MKTKSHKESYLFFYNILGFFPQNIDFYQQAIIHSSSAIKNNSGQYINNERLEFLGDAVLSAVISDVLYLHYKNKDEGFLSNTRSKIVQRETLNKLALDIGLDKIIVTSKKNNIQKDNIYGNAFEALIGAIYLDQGYDKCKNFIEEKIFTANLNLDKIVQKEINFKSKIFEFAQKNKISLSFSSNEELRNHDNKKIFKTEIFMNNISVATGIGLSKKESQQNASQVVYKKIKKEKHLLIEKIQNEHSQQVGS